MKKNGCSYNGGVCLEVVEQCEGCGQIGTFAAGRYCSTYPAPALKWKNGNCNFATHIKTAQVAKGKVNPLKASKRASRKK
jgi:hypothetical protein